MNLLIIFSLILFVLSLYKDGYILNKKEQKNEDNKKEQFSFKVYAWKQFKKNKAALIALYLLGLLTLVAIFAPFIANEKPLYAIYKGKVIYPVFDEVLYGEGKYIINQNSDDEEIIEFNELKTSFLWKELEYDKVIWAPITFSPNTQDEYNTDYASPTDKQQYRNYQGNLVECPKGFRHFLGTDQMGRDLAAGLIHGTRISLKIGLISMGIASIIGILLGAFAGFFGDRGLKMRRIKYYFTLIGIFLGLFYGYGSRKYIIQDGFNNGTLSGFFELFISLLIFIGIILIFRQLSRLIQIKSLNKEVTVPIDSFVSRGIELLNSIPRLILIITVSAVVKEPSIIIIMVIIGLTSWTGIARFTRAEFLRIRSLEYISASKSLGFSSTRTIFRHALPNSLAPVFVSIAFGIASAILIESGLSFLGIGVPEDIVTWGSLLNLGRQYHEAWWLIIFPGIAIFITITIYNMIAEASRDALDPKLKS